MSPYFRVGLNWPYDRDPADERAFALMERLDAKEVTITSHAARGDYERLLRDHPDLLWHVRMKTGWPNRGHWPSDALRWKEWADEQNALEALLLLVKAGHVPHLLLGNEPDIELTLEPVDDFEHMQAACSFYINWAANVLSVVRNDPRLKGRVRVSLAPLSQGSPGRFLYWAHRLDRLYRQCDFIAVHNYTDGRPFTDRDWGDGAAYYRAEYPGIPIHNTETNDNGKLFGHVGRPTHYAAYVNFCQDRGDRCVSLFAAPGGKQDRDKPAWWFVDEAIIDAVVGRADLEDEEAPDEMVAVGPGVLAKMKELGDHPLSDEDYHENSDGSTWSETLGTKGKYYASNASGAWEVTFAPFGVEDGH